MDGTRKVLAVFALIVLVIAFVVPSMAQTTGVGTSRTGQQASQATPQGGQPQQSKNLMATMQNISEISIFTAAVKATGYDKTLNQSQGRGQGQGQNPIMVFAPTDKAIQRELGIGNASALIGNPAKARSLVENNIVLNAKQPAQGARTLTLTSISGKQITAAKTDSAITVNGLNVTNATVASNGVLIVTDGIVGK